MDSACYVSLVLEGDLPSNEEIVSLLGSDVLIRRKGETYKKRRPYTENVAQLSLTEWELKNSADYQKSHVPLEQAADVIRQLAPKLLTLCQSPIRKSVRISMAIRNWQGAFEIPIDFIQAVNEAGLTIYISWLADFDDDEEPEGNTQASP